MNYIIYDIEATCWDGAPPSDTQEIIELGAVRLNDYGEVMGTFDKFVRPVVHPRLSVICQQLTSIRQEDVDRSRKFPDVIEHFQNWADMHDEDYILCSWGDFDRSIMIDNCELHKMDSYWVDYHIDLKKQYKKIKGLKKTQGLMKSLTKEGFEFTGIEHRAISDAENLAKIFIKYFDEWVV